MKPYIFVIDGPDGVGKSSIIESLVTYFNTSTSYHAIAIAPMGTSLGKKVKEIITKNELDVETERSLAQASLYHLYHECIHPRLNEPNLIFFVDRWTLSHYVYQGYLNDRLDEFRDRAINIECLFQPTIYFVLDAEDKLLDQRILSRLESSTDRFEQLKHRQDIRQAYRLLSKYKYYNVVRVSDDLEQNKKKILSLIIDKLQR